MPSSGPVVAVIDVGSNSIKLLVAARGDPPVRLRVLLSETAETRIGGGIDGDRPLLAGTAMAAGCDAIETLLRRARPFAPAASAIVATSAVRDATNGGEFAEAVRQRTGLELRILDGDAEARYIGRGLALDPAVPAAGGFSQFDLGGGSLELVRFTDREVRDACSLPLGAVRLTERHVADPAAPLDARAAAAIRDQVTAAIAGSACAPAGDDGILLATGGAVTVARAILGEFNGLASGQSPPLISRSDLDRLRRRISDRPLEERLAVPGLPSARADIFPAAIEIIDAVLAVHGRDACAHSFYNLRHGVADALLDEL